MRRASKRTGGALRIEDVREEFRRKPFSHIDADRAYICYSMPYGWAGGWVVVIVEPSRGMYEYVILPGLIDGVRGPMRRSDDGYGSAAAAMCDGLNDALEN